MARRGVKRFLGWTLALLVVLTVAAVLFARSTLALEWAAARLSASVAQVGGRLEFEALSGSLFNSIRAERIDYTQDDGLRAQLNGVEIDPRLAALWNRQLVLNRIAIDSVEVDLAPTDEPATEPESLALPVEVIVTRATIGRLLVRSGEALADPPIELQEIALGYRGGPRRHDVEGLSLRAPALAGPGPDGTVALAFEGGIDATAPFALAGRVRAATDAIGAADLMLAGRLGLVEVAGALSGRGEFSWVKAQAEATVAPFVPQWLPRARVETRGIDAAAVVAGAPRTALDLRVDLSVTRDQPITGQLTATNRLPGEIGAERIPLVSFDTRFSVDPVARRATFAPLRAELRGGGQLAGRGTVSAPAVAPGTPVAVTSDWQLEAARVDLKSIDARLVETRLGGRIDLSIHPERQRFDVALAQRDMRLEAVGQRAGMDILIERLLARASAAAGSSEATGRGRINLDGERPFEVDLQLRSFDPSRFVASALPAPGPSTSGPVASGAVTGTSALEALGMPALPAASINATVTARGRLVPAWRVRLDADFAPSQVALAVPTAAEPSPRTVAFRGHVRGLFSPDRVDDADILVAVGRNNLRVIGSTGITSSALEVAFTSPDLAQLVPGLAGQLNATASITGDLRKPAARFQMKATRLAWEGSTAAELSAGGAVDLGLADIPLDVKFDARALVVGGMPVAQTAGRIAGTTLQHTLSLSLRAQDIDAQVVLEGGLPPASKADGGSVAALVSTWRERMPWRGRLMQAQNAGRYPLKLSAPAGLELSPQRAALAPALVLMGDGRLHVEELRWEPGRLATRGSLAGFPAGGLVDLLADPAPGAGKTAAKAEPVPYISTLRIGGQWSLTSTPRLNGTVTIRREDGDVSLRGSPPLMLGLTRVDLEARFTDDRLQAQAQVSGSVLGDASASLVLEPAPGLSAASPMTLRADLAIRTLKPFERFVGALVDIDGSVSAAIQGTGSPAKPVLSGTLRAERLRVDAPQLGISFRDGRLDSRLVNGVLEVVSLDARAGEGTFTASGSIPLRTGVVAPALNWKADRLTVQARPDRRIVIDGEGRLTTDGGQLLLAGRVVVRQGFVEFGQRARTQLSDDVVVLGRKPRPVTGAAGRSPLALKLQIDFGNAFRVVGSGLDTLLTGQLMLTTTQNGTLSAQGTINTGRGTFSAFGQRLELARGQIVFNGPIDNPGVDVLALRRLPSVEVGVQVTGTVNALRIQTTSEPPMPQGEQLSWLLLGRSLDAASQGDAALIAGVAASMLGGGNGGVPLTRRIADAFGLDDIGLRDSGAIDGQVFTIGKRLSDRIYIAYEQTMTTATNLLRIDFEIHRYVSLRAEAGAISGFGIFYTRSLR